MKIIFHNPMPLISDSTSASGIRPVRMLEAFQRLGYDVTVVAGYGAERSVAIKKIRNDLAAGVKYSFCYSESSTQPTLLTEKNHLPLYPNLDFSFLSFLRKNNIPVGLFYRDIYWLFDDYNKSINFIKAFVAKIFYKYDLIKYNSSVSRLYLPSMEMAGYVPIVSRELISSSPPGHSVDEYYDDSSEKVNCESISLIYVGGISAFYEMHELFRAMPVDGVNMTLCTRDLDWSRVCNEYIEFGRSNINIVHKSGDELKVLYDSADIGLLFVKPDEYWAFSEPVKLYEYLGKLKPVIASEGTLAAKFVKQNEIGWVVPYSASALRGLLSYLISHPEEIVAAKSRCKVIASRHTWQERAKRIASDLTEINA